MSIATELTRLQTAKANIKTSIENKGVTVSSDALLDAYPTLIDSITTEEKGYTEWPSNVPTHTQLSTMATEWASGLGSFSSISYIVFKGNQIDDPFFQNYLSASVNAYYYFSDTQETSQFSIPSGGYLLDLSSHSWSDQNPYHWVFIAGKGINGFKNWNFFYSNNTTDGSPFYNTDENGAVFAPSDTNVDFTRLKTQLCGYSTWGYDSPGWKAPVKLPQISSTSIGFGSYDKMNSIRELHFKSGVVPTQVSISSGQPDSLVKISADSLPLTSNSFKNCKNLREIDATLTLSGTSLYNAFNTTYSLKSFTWPDTSAVTNMNYMFGGSRIENISILSGLDTSGATDMSYMFYSTWMKEYPTLDYSSATTLKSIFQEVRFAKGSCTINAPNCTDISSAFSYGNLVETIHINAPKNTTLNMACAYCGDATTIDITPASTAKVTNFGSCFSGCNKITALNAMNTSNATTYSSMFNNCTSLTTLGTEQVTDANGDTVNSWIFNYSVDLGYSPLNLASIKHVMENLKSGVSSQTFKLSKTSKTYLEAEPATDGTSANLYEQLAAEATTKGWTVSVNDSY